LWTNVTQKVNILFVFNNIFYENRDVYEIMWANMLEPKRPQIKV